MSVEMDELAEGLWTRLRNVLIGLDRLDRLDTATEFDGWIEAFQTDPAEIEATARDWALRAVRLGMDPINYDILHQLQAGEMTIGRLMAITHLTRVDLSERVKDLAQVGFVVQALETDGVQATAAGQGIVRWLESLVEPIAARARAGLAKDNPPPVFHRPAPISGR